MEGAVSLTQASYGGTGFADGDEMVMRRLVAPSGVRQCATEDRRSLAA